MAPSAPALIRHDHGIATVDAEYVRPGFASVHVLVRDGAAAIIDAGANSSVPLVLRALDELGIEPARVEWLFLTHVHLDHAGGAGLLLRELPAARVLVHPRGASHLIDPTRLEAASIAVYGKSAYERLYGELVPLPAERVVETREAERLRLGSTELSILHTPGHALHHQVLFDPEANAVFTGDTFGLSYRELDTEAGAFLLPTTTPTQFEPQQLLDSARRIEELRPEALFLTHYGRVTGVPRLAALMREQVDSFVAIARSHAAEADRFERIRSGVRDELVARVRAHGIANAAAAVDDVLGSDVELNTQGLVAWLERIERRRA